MSSTVNALRRRFYDSRRPIWVDGTTAFRNLVRSYLRSDMRILNLGAGAGVRALHFDRDVQSVVGLDPDASVATNPHLTHGVRGTAEALPFHASSFDAVYLDWVVEHLADPVGAIREIARVLKPGGHLMFRTGNLLHYQYAISRFTPHSFHRFVIRRLVGGDEASDPYPTYYRMNTVATVRRVMSEAGLQEESLIMYESDPAYVGFSVPTMLLGIAYERLVNRFAGLAGLRANIFGCYRL